jgi:hypothetical protein
VSRSPKLPPTLDREEQSLGASASPPALLGYVSKRPDTSLRENLVTVNAFIKGMPESPARKIRMTPWRAEYLSTGLPAEGRKFWAAMMERGRSVN